MKLPPTYSNSYTDSKIYSYDSTMKSQEWGERRSEVNHNSQISFVSTQDIQPRRGNQMNESIYIYVTSIIHFSMTPNQGALEIPRRELQTH